MSPLNARLTETESQATQAETCAGRARLPPSRESHSTTTQNTAHAKISKLQRSKRPCAPRGGSIRRKIRHQSIRAVAGPAMDFRIDLIRNPADRSVGHG